MSSGIVLARIFFCGDCIALKNPRSSILKLREFGGWQVNQISSLLCEVASRKPGSVGGTCVLKLSCWMKTISSYSDLGHFP